jgi:hypothetical protein
MYILSQTKKTEIVDVAIVNSVIWAEGWGRGERGKSQGVGSSYQTRDQSGWEFATMSKKLAIQVSWGFYYFAKSLIITACILCEYQVNGILCKHKRVLVCRLKINHAWSAASLCV